MQAKDLTEEEKKLLAALHADPALRKKVAAILEAPELLSASQATQHGKPQ